MTKKTTKPAAKTAKKRAKPNPNGYLDPKHAWPMPDKNGKPISDGVKQ